jgi:hypothetical protein
VKTLIGHYRLAGRMRTTPCEPSRPVGRVLSWRSADLQQSHAIASDLAGVVSSVLNVPRMIAL